MTNPGELNKTDEQNKAETGRTESKEVIAVEMNDQQLESYATGVKENITRQASRIESGAVQTIESSVKSMGASQEFVDQAVNQGEINSQLKSFQEQANELARQANGKIESVATEAGEARISEKEQGDKLKQLNDFRDRWLIRERINKALEKGQETGKYVVKEEDGTSIRGEEAIKAMEARNDALSQEIIDIASSMAGQTSQEFMDKLKEVSGYNKDESKKSDYEKLLREEEQKLYKARKSGLEQASGKIVANPRKRKEMAEARKNKVSQEQPNVEASPIEQQKPPEARVEIPVPKKSESEISTEISENILEGNAIEQIEKVGWQGYRDELVKLSFADIAERQFKQIDKLGRQETGVESSESEIFKRNTDALERIRVLSEQIQQKYGENQEYDFYAYQEGGKKLNFRGKKPYNEEGTQRPLDGKLTRFYLSVQSGTAPEAFMSLFESLKTAGVMDRTQLTLNLENYMGESLKDNVVFDNTILIYASGKDSQLMTDIVAAIDKAKKANKELFEMPAKDIGKSKKDMAMGFKIPLDNTTSFVEAATNRSYDAFDSGDMFKEITGGTPRFVWQKIGKTDQDFLQRLKRHSRENQGVFEEESSFYKMLKKRRKYMPGLVFDGEE